jgi:hypothetical protein
LLPARLAQAVVNVLPIAGAGISIFGDSMAEVPVGASDDTAAYAERLHFSTADAPQLSADRRALVFASETVLADRWPQFYSWLSTRTPYHAIAVVPLHTRWADVGALNIYCHHSQDLLNLEPVDLQALSERITTTLLITESPDADALPPWLSARSAATRRQVFVAMGMLGQAIDIPLDDALALLRAHAYASGRTVDEVAAELISARIPVELLQLDSNS